VKTRSFRSSARTARRFHLALVDVTFGWRPRSAAGDRSPRRARAGRRLARARLRIRVLAQAHGGSRERGRRALGDERRVAIGTDAPTIDPQWIADAMARPEPSSSVPPTTAATGSWARRDRRPRCSNRSPGRPRRCTRRRSPVRAPRSRGRCPPALVRHRRAADLARLADRPALPPSLRRWTG
jgi:hypothetical protein